MTRYAKNHEFDKLVAGEADVDLVHLMLEFAGDAYTELDGVGCLMEIDALGVACVDVGAGDRALRLPDRLTAISRVLYETEGFHGNREDYYDPRNSYLNEVLARRRGIPISLGILYRAVAARAGVKTFGVNLPGHFIIGCTEGNDVWYVDPFTRGDVLDRATCTRRVEEMTGQSGIVCDEHFRPATAQEIAARVLRNLKAVYAMQDRWALGLSVQKRLTALLPRATGEQRDLGLAYLRAGEPARALSVLEPYLSACPREQAEALAPWVRTARRMMAERN